MSASPGVTVLVRSTSGYKCSGATTICRAIAYCLREHGFNVSMQPVGPAKLPGFAPDLRVIRVVDDCGD